MNLEPAVLGALEREGECREGLRGPQPDVAALAPVELRLERALMALAGLAVGSVGRDDEVGVVEPCFRVHFPLEVLAHTELRCAFLQDPEQPLAADAAESMTAADEAAAGKVDIDVVPV